MHSSVRARLRVIPNSPPLSSSSADDDDPDVNATHPVSPGAVIGFFTYESNTQESDIEILTSDPVDRIRYSNQPDYDAKTGNTVPGASTDYLIQDSSDDGNSKVWTDWLIHRLDWFPGVSQWWIDDQLVLNKTINVPKRPSGVILNVWSDGGEWSGNMSVGEEVRVGVEWIEMVFNVSGRVEGPSSSRKRWTERLGLGLLGKRKERKCKVGCWVDAPQVVVAGEPVVAFNDTVTGGAGRLGVQGRGGGLGVVYGFFLILGLLD